MADKLDVFLSSFFIYFDYLASAIKPIIKGPNEIFTLMHQNDNKIPIIA